MERSAFESIKPVHIGWTADGKVQIVWDDAHESTYELAYLREQCPCATCKGHHGPPTTLVRQSRGGLPILQTQKPKPQPSIEVKGVVPVGQYAIRFTWGDGHDSGLYSWRYLRTLDAAPNTDEAAN